MEGIMRKFGLFLLFLMLNACTTEYIWVDDTKLSSADMVVNEQEEYYVDQVNKNYDVLLDEDYSNIKKLNELEILQSELYILKELDSKDVYLKECQEDIKVIII